MANDASYILGLILLFPLLGAVINGLIGHRLPPKFIYAIGAGAIGSSFALALYLGVGMWSNQLVELPGGDEHHQRYSINAPRVEWTAFEWINSGDWAEGEQGYVPVEQFRVGEPLSYGQCWNPFRTQAAFVEHSALDFNGCVAHYTPQIRGQESVEAQTGIGGVRARLQGDSHRFGGLSIALKLVADSLSMLMLLMITGVAFLIHVYSAGYMRHDRSKARFFAYMNLFVFSMLLLILGGNLVVMFIGWEGVGLCSYLLIGYYYEGTENANAGKKAFIVNRIGDFAFVL
ncbi:MAG: proton-conducting transporter membrane subunit, partial [Myxococcota bacterium]|nr:proton-conducting transporter membrane subunit [Myxococcota bacterium]